MTENPSNRLPKGSKDTVTVEMDRETANVLDAHPEVDLEIEAEESNGSAQDKPRATTRSLSDLLELIPEKEKRKAIERGANHYVRHFIATKCFFDLKSSSAEGYVSALNEYVELVPFDSTDPFLTADWKDVTKYIRKLIGNGNRWKTFKGKINLLKQFYRHINAEFSAPIALDMAYVEQLDPDNYEVEVDDIERSPLSPEEVRTLVDALDSFRDRLIVRVVYQAALRNSEVRNLRIQDFDRNLEAPKIHIEDSKNGKDRTVPLTQELALDLEQWIEVERPSFSPYAPESEYLFPSKTGTKLSSNQSVWRIVYDAAEEADLHDQVDTRADGKPKYEVDVHTLRHTGNSHWKDCGIGIEQRMKVLGHEDRETTEGYSPDSDRDQFGTFRHRFNPAV